MNVLGTATDQEMTVSTQSSPATQTVQPPVQTQQLETAERWKFSAKVSDSLIVLRLFRENALEACLKLVKLWICWCWVFPVTFPNDGIGYIEWPITILSSSPGRGHKSWGSTVSDDSVGGEGALESPSASTSESHLRNMKQAHSSFFYWNAHSSQATSQKSPGRHPLEQCPQMMMQTKKMGPKPPLNHKVSIYSIFCQMWPG